MKKSLFIACLALLQSFLSVAQTVDTARNPNDFHRQQVTGYARPIPYPFLRETDVVWSTELWKTIYVGELFNQFFYFPDDDQHTFGKKSLAYILWDAMAANEIPIYEDDDLLVPIDNEILVRRYTKADTLTLEVGYDDDDNEIYQTFIKPKFFDGSEIFEYNLRETWFIGRQDTRQDSRRIALAPVKPLSRDMGNGHEIYIGVYPIFWIPMQHPSVRALLARYSAFIDPNNMVRQPSWDWVFVNQHYEAYITRESNVYNRPISGRNGYLADDDALLESALIEEKVFEIESDMWEY